METIFLGNCQAAVLANAFREQGREAKHLFLPRVGLGPHRISEVRRRLAQALGEPGMREAMRRGHVYFQPGLQDVTDHQPRRLVVSLGQEYRRHGDSGLAVHMPGEDGSLEALPSLADLQDRTGPLFYNRLAPGGDPSATFDRLHALLATLRAALPDAPLVVLKRLSPLPCLGPSPLSWPGVWREGWRLGYERLAAMQREIPLLHVVDYDRILAALAASGSGVDEFTALTFHVEGEGPEATLRLARDIEHLDGAFVRAVMQETLSPDFAPLPLPWPPPWIEPLERAASPVRFLPGEELLELTPRTIPAACRFLADSLAPAFRTLSQRILATPLAQARRVAVHPVEPRHVRGLLGGAARLALYGAGGRGRTLLRFLRETVPECEVAGFLDSDPAQRGRLVDGLPVAGPEALEGWGVQAVAVSTHAKHAVASTLRRFRRETGGGFAVFTGLDELHAAHCFAALRELL